MKKLTLCALALGFMLTTSCEKEEQSFDESNFANVEEVLASKRKCYASEMLEKQLQEDPMMAKRMSDIEQTSKILVMLRFNLKSTY
ncbi:hypothetical protein [Aquimarina intermedia]|uniref:Lipoprotein n=1 Tax=Aquimarina intermedia TaxID=350814 RepID=A0A5S5CC58_9FLAO|nr:hypothetical protein [Aquimarina intermedia]TYP76951.1 hypothetical protein BD809_10197 [Aquimarina intermedia]